MLALLEVALHLPEARAARRVGALASAHPQQHHQVGRPQLEPAALDALAALGLLRGAAGTGWDIASLISIAQVRPRARTAHESSAWTAAGWLNSSA